MRLRSAWTGRITGSAARCIALILFLGVPARGALAPQRRRIENLDGRALEQPAQSQLADVPVLQREVSGARIDFDPVLASPVFIANPDGFLTGPDGVGNAIASQTLAALPANDSDRITKAFLNEHAALFGYDAAVLAAAQRKEEIVAPHTGLRTVVWQQEVSGLPVYGALLISHTTQRGELVNVSSHFVPDPQSAAGSAAATISAADAVALAAGNVGDTNTSPRADSRQVWLPVSRGELRLCWQVEFTSRELGEMFRVLVDAENGRVWIRQGLTEYYSDATYRVYTSDSPSPFSPACSTPCTTQPSIIARDLVTISALASNSSPAGWITDGQNTTLGNNVDAHLDKNADDVADTGSRPVGSPFRVFDFAMDLSQEPVIYTNAAVVQLFYWNNWMHDRLYELGFNEAARNFQTDNFGRGGVGNDAVQADAQDGSGFNNANFSTPSDGSAGRMQMYLFNGPTPNRDGDFDADVVLHEYTHGLSNRRVGGGVGLSALASRGMGEGWSDFYALSLLSQDGDDVNGNYAAGGYLTYQLSGLTQNYYYGIRRYPYSTVMSKSPLTFKDIDPSQASSHAGVPISPGVGVFISTSASEVHNIGEVWCVTLWDARANLINKFGWATGNQLILQLVTDGMNLSPANPTFLQARDAILQADQVLTGGANRNELWAAFAKRGMGVSATAPASSTTTGVVEAYDIPDTLKLTPGTGLTSDGAAGGPFTPNCQAYVLTNTGTLSFDWSTSHTQTWVSVTPAGGTLGAAAAVSVSICLNSGANALGYGTYSDAVTFSNAVTGVVQARAVSLSVHGPTVFLADFEDGSGGYSPDGFTYTSDPDSTSNLWHGSTNRYVSATHAQYYGLESTKTYNTGARTAGNLQSPSISLASLISPVVLTYKYFKATENSSSWDILTVQISSNAGSTWITLSTPPDVSTFTTFSSDISAYAGENILLRFNFDTIDSVLNAYEGVYIDDVIITGTPAQPSIVVAVPATATEGDGTVPGNVFLSSVATNDVTVTLTSSDTSEATVPVSVTVLTGTTNAAFNITIVDDSEIDGTQSANITGTSAGYNTGAGTIQVQDNEAATLSISAPATVTEGDGVLVNAGAVYVSSPVSTNVVVALNSSDTTEITVPASVTILTGQTNATFSVTVVDDSLIDGSQNATITAHVAGWTDGNAMIAVTDNETTNLTVTLPAFFREGQAPTTNGCTVRIAGTLPGALVVNLSSSDTTELTVPPTVMIPAGQISVAFTATVVDDSVTDGTQPVTVTASASGFNDGSTNSLVLDNDVDHFVWSSVASPQYAALPLGVSVVAADVNGLTISNYSDTITLSASGDAESVGISPTTVSTFTNGVWSGSVVLSSPDTNVRLLASEPGGHTGQSNPFDVSTIAVLGVSPATGAVFTGNVGGPFTPSNQVYVVTNSGSAVLIWSAGKSQSWLDLSATGGSLGVGVATNVTVSINSNANSLAYGNYSDSVSFSNLTSGVGTTNRPVSLGVTSLSNGLIAYYPFNGDANDASGNGNNGTIVNATFQTTSANGKKALQFAGNSSSYVVVPRSAVLEPTNALSISMWCYGAAGGQTCAGTYGTALRKCDPCTAGYSFKGCNPSTFYIDPPNPCAGGAKSAAFPLFTGTNWQHIVGTYSVTDGTLKAYENGVLVAQTAYSNLLSHSGSLYIGGAAADGGDGGFNGLMNEVRIYNRALSAAEVQQLYASGGATNLPGGLTVSPTNGLTSSGTQGGPFSPSSQVYTLTNNGTTTFSWSASKSQSWVALSATNGTLAGGASVNLTASINSNANTLATGNYSDALSFANLTDGVGSTTRPVSLTVSSPGILVVTPTNGLNSVGALGGPFTPANQVYTLTNSGGFAVVWAANNSQNWLNLSSAGGTLTPGTGVTVVASINSNANALAVGGYSDNIVFTNLTNGVGSTNRNVNLTVNPGSPVIGISPSSGATFAGGVGGPFLPSNQVYVVTNSGGAVLTWSAGKGQSWLDLSATNGSLGIGAATNVVVSINSNANVLALGNYTDVISFSNLTSGVGTTNRQVILGVTSLGSGLVAYYPFNGDANDASGNGNNGTVVGASFQSTGSSGKKALQFAGSISSYMVAPASASLQPTNALSIAMWCNGVPGQACGGGWGTILRKADNCVAGYAIRGCNGGAGIAIFPPNPCSGGIATNAAFPSFTGTNWQHIVATYSISDGALKTYMNGVLISQNPYSSLLSHSGSLYIGGANVASDDGGFNGLINEVRIYNRSLTAAEVQQLYSSGSATNQPGGLAITPTNGLAANGTQGGPFSPSSQAYTITNSGSSTFAWAASKSQNWLNLSATNGTLTVGASATVNVLLNTNANSLAAGAYADSVIFTNLTSGTGSTNRLVNLTVNGIASLGVSPAGGLSSTGFVGGAFSPNSLIYTLTNNGTAVLAWGASKTQSWVTLSISNGTLNVGRGTNVTVTINSNANSLAVGSYSDAVNFNNLTNGIGSTTRAVNLIVNGIGILGVTPTGTASFNGPIGGAFSPAGQSYVLTNAGSASLDWSIIKTQTWTALSASAGTLPVGASTTVTVSISTNANALPAGSFADTLKFTNTTFVVGSTNRSVNLTIFVPAPVLNPEPPFTGGSCNSISWSPVLGVQQYYAEFDMDPAFGSPDGNSNWTNVLSFTFCSLTNNVRYYYHVKARQTAPAVIESAWSDIENSRQDATPPALAITTPADNSFVTNNTIGVAGTATDLSGIIAVLVNATASSTTNGFAQWNATQTGLVVGTNALTVVATDNVIPANSATNIIRVIYATGNFDSDGDGLPDVWELTYFGGVNSQSGSDDTDGDGFTNAQELLAGTNPTDPQNALRVQNCTPTGSDIVISFSSVVGKSYIVEYKADFSDVQWTSLSNVTANATNTQVTDVNGAGQSVRFYRVRLAP